MIYIEIKDEKGGLEKSLKKFKTKFKQTKVVEELRQRQAFEKPSVTRRKQVIKAKYRQSNQTQD
jgi:small subunit ribosomal protein S21